MPCPALPRTVTSPIDQTYQSNLSIKPDFQCACLTFMIVGHEAGTREGLPRDSATSLLLACPRSLCCLSVSLQCAVSRSTCVECGDGDSSSPVHIIMVRHEHHGSNQQATSRMHRSQICEGCSCSHGVPMCLLHSLIHSTATHVALSESSRHELDEARQSSFQC